MALVLTVLNYRRQPMAQPRSERFDASSVTVGRAPENDWTLPDPDQLISKKHCTIRFEGGRYAITDTSTNGVFINGSPQPVGHGRSEPLADGDHLQIGEYEILVGLEGVAPALPLPQPAAAPRADDPFGLGSFDFRDSPLPGSPAPPLAPSTPPPSFSSTYPTPPASGFAPPASGGFPGPGEDPFALAPAPAGPGFGVPPQGAPLIPEGPDWLREPAPAGGEIAADQFAQPDHLAAEHVQFTAPSVAPGPGAIPDNWNPLSETAPPPIQQPPLRPQIPPTAAPGPVVVERVPGRGIPVPPTMAPPPQPGPLPFDAVGLPPAGAAPGFETSGFGQAIAPPGVEAGVLAPAVAPRAPVAAPQPAPAPRPMPAAVPVAAAVDAGQLLAAFLEGAGLDPAALQGQDPAEVMALAGRLFRDMASGLRDALSTRAMIKAEYRVEQTVIRAAKNNPLKFSADIGQLMAALLSRGQPGYLPGAEAVAEGFKDLRVHELALLGGMQQAVAALLKQFDPEQLKQRLEQQSLLQNLLPAARKAKYWEIYEEHFKQIAADVSEDVRGTFGRAFANAYEEQARKL
jgi:type VI secretion system protein